MLQCNIVDSFFFFRMVVLGQFFKVVMVVRVRFNGFLLIQIVDIDICIFYGFCNWLNVMINNVCIKKEIFKSEQRFIIVCVVIVICTCFFLQDIYNMMIKEYGIFEWVCYVIFVIVIILFGFIFGLVSIYVGYLVLFIKKVQNFIKYFYYF